MRDAPFGPEPLAAFNLLRENGIDEVFDVLADKGWNISVGSVENRKARDARFNTVHLPAGTHLSFVRYGLEAHLRAPPERDDYAIFLAAGGRFESVIAGEEVHATSRLGVVVNPEGEQRTRAACDSGRLIFHVPISVMQRHIAAMLGEIPAAALRFETGLRLDEGPATGLADLLRFAVGAFARDGLRLSRGPLAASLESMLVQFLLFAQPHNLSPLFEPVAAGRPVSTDVRRATDFIQANLGEPLSLADIAQSTGVPGRTLQAHFSHFHGESLFAYIRSARLRRAHQRLTVPDGTETVTEIALQCGFVHLGRFAAEYRKRFGESPSATAARVRRRPASVM